MPSDESTNFRNIPLCPDRSKTRDAGSHKCEKNQENKPKLRAADNVKAQRAKTTEGSTQTQAVKSPEAAADTDEVSKTKLSSGVSQDLITSPFTLVLIQSKRTSNEHSHASPHVSLAASTGLQETSAADNTDGSKDPAKPKTSVKPGATTKASSSRKRVQLEVSPS